MRRFTDYGLTAVQTSEALGVYRANAYKWLSCCHGEGPACHRSPTNGKAERFIRTLHRERVYAEFYLANDERWQAPADWLSHYKHERLTPRWEAPPKPFRVNAVCGRGI